MADEFAVTGAEDFYRLSKALKAAGQTELRKELNKALKGAVKPLLPEAGDALAAGVPPRLAARAARTKQVVKVRTGADPGVSVGVPYGARGSGLGAGNAQLANRSGRIRHPVFGHRRTWATTAVPSAQGWFDRTYGAAAPRIRVALEQVLQDVADQIVKEAK